jgi:taurine dioxygenase
VIEVKKLEHERHNFGGIWHSDTTYLEAPPMGSSAARAPSCPPFGGDTLFANQYPRIRIIVRRDAKLLDGLIAVNSSANADVSRTREDRVREQVRTAERTRFGASRVRTHRRTDAKRCM